MATKKKKSGGTHNAARAEADAKKAADEKAADKGASGVELTALKNVPADLAGTERRVYRGATFTVPPSVARVLRRDGLAE